jgi:lipopolysaccharide export system protein LptC
MKSKNNPPRYLDALLTRAFSKEGSKDYERANQYIEHANKKIETSNGKISPHQK